MKRIIIAVAAAVLGLVALPLGAEPAVIVQFSSFNTCFDADGNQLVAETVSKGVITNSKNGNVNIVRKGVCPTTSKRAVNWTYEDYPLIAGCFGGPEAGILDYWKYHMRPDGKYTLKCQSHPFGKK